MIENVPIVAEPIVLIIIVIIALICGLMFFIADFYDHKHPRFHASLIAGISLAYFFLVVLPEIEEGMPEYPLHLKMFEYLFVLIGFVFVHVSEKLIIQKVEAGSQARMRKLIQKEKMLVEVKKNIEKVLNDEIKQENLDKAALKSLVQTISDLNEQGDQMEVEIQMYKAKIQAHINKDFDELRFFTDFIYHFLVGLLIFFLLIIDILTGLLFCIFALFRAWISNRSESHIVFTDLDISVEFHETKLIKYILSSAALFGVIAGLIFELTFPINLELIFILFAFISGIILYTIVIEGLPEKEKGKPIYFLIGIIGFTVVIVIIKFLQHTLH